jgi:hypothetical protein
VIARGSCFVRHEGGSAGRYLGRVLINPQPPPQCAEGANGAPNARADTGGAGTGPRHAAPKPIEPSGWRGWLENPVPHWEDSEIECSCKPWAPSAQESSLIPSSQITAKIEVWQDDIFRLWGRTGEGLQINPPVHRNTSAD